LARRFKIKVDGWERNFALKARENPAVTAKEFGDDYLALVQAFEAAFPKIAEHYGEITAVDFTLLPYSFERGVPIHLSAALDVFTRQVRNFVLHEGWPTAEDSVQLLKAISGEPLFYVRSDWGSIYRARTFSHYLDRIGAYHDLIPKGAPFFNGHIESFFKTFKRMLAQHGPAIADFPALEKATAATMADYNRKKSLGL
jgi:transposase InsO family protein